MGSAPSKAARKLPREKPSWAGAWVPPQTTAEQRPERQLAFEHKNEAIERDAKDPHFMEKLSQLGQVRVDHHTHHVRAASDVQHMYHSRIRSEAQASNLQPTTNRLLVSSLTELLEARKSVANDVELASLATRFHVDVATLHRLGRVVTTPSVDEGTVVRRTNRDGEESLTMRARWVDPVLSRA